MAHDRGVPPGVTKVYDGIVLGAGISGLVSASVLLEKGARTVLVIDEYERVGGNHLDFSIDGYTFDVGSLIFQDDSPLVHRFPELLPRYVPVEPTWSRLNPQGKVTDYPFSMKDDLVAAGPAAWASMAASLVASRFRYRNQRNARDFTRFWVGTKAAERTGLEHYIERFCGLPSEVIDLDFARARMMWIADNARVWPRVTRAARGLRKRLARRGPEVEAPTQRRTQQLVRPREGFDALYRPLVERLESEGVEFLLSTPSTAIERADESLVVRTSAGDFSSPMLVSTVPTHRALALVGVDSEPLPTVTIISLLCSFAGRRGFDTSILYNFSHDGSWKRLTMHSDFYGPVREREYFCVEVVGSGSVRTVAEAEKSFREHTQANGLFHGDLRIEGGHVLENVYPVFTGGSAARAADQVALLHDHGVTSLGKQGGFDYQPTARVSTRNAEKKLGGTVSPK
ncbi:FAD-dependent oxidoreductase [Demequina salsinemoris]|uniref:FAD-dependent oxidoreductase n=1 Tax=Demequina salsinemoris TaxID=577470 RepID=UPI0007837BB5|nr:NAD(P)-binding protein [Demequina salsinemoris]